MTKAERLALVRILADLVDGIKALSSGDHDRAAEKAFSARRWLLDDDPFSIHGILVTPADPKK